MTRPLSLSPVQAAMGARRRWLQQSLALAGLGLLGANAQAAPKEASGPTKVLKVLRVGVTTGPHEQVFEVVRKVAERDYGLKI